MALLTGPTSGGSSPSGVIGALLFLVIICLCPILIWGRMAGVVGPLIPTSSYATPSTIISIPDAEINNSTVIIDTAGDDSYIVNPPPKDNTPSVISTTAKSTALVILATLLAVVMIFFSIFRGGK